MKNNRYIELLLILSYNVLSFRAMQNLIDTHKNACIFMGIYQILYGGYASSRKCVAFSRLALYDYLSHSQPDRYP